MDAREKYGPYIGVNYEAGITDCLTVARRVYQEIYNIPVTNYARPTGWEDYPEFDFFQRLYATEGFENPTNNVMDLREGDVLFMNVLGPDVNHCAIYLGQNLILHHLKDHRSAIDSYTYSWRNRVRLVLRHKLRETNICRQGIQIMELLPDHLKLRLATNMEQNK